MDVADIYRAYRNNGTELIAILGDLNDTPASGPLAPILTGTDLADIATAASFDDGGRPGTHGSIVGHRRLLAGLAITTFKPVVHLSRPRELRVVESQRANNLTRRRWKDEWFAPARSSEVQLSVENAKEAHYVGGAFANGSSRVADSCAWRTSRCNESRSPNNAYARIRSRCVASGCGSISRAFSHAHNAFDASPACNASSASASR